MKTSIPFTQNGLFKLRHVGYAQKETGPEMAISEKMKTFTADCGC